MGLPPSGSLKESVELIRIETNLFDLYIQGKPFHPTVEVLQLHKTITEDLVDTVFEVFPSTKLSINAIKVFSPSKGQLQPLENEKVYPLFYENQSYEFVLQKKVDDNLTFFHENINLRRAVKPLGRELLVGILNFQNEVGYTDLEIYSNKQLLLTLRLEIYPSKIDYQKDYQTILLEVNEQIYNLAFDFLRKTYHLTALKETKNQSLTEFFVILQSIFSKLARSVERIQITPHHKLSSSNEVRRVEQVKRVGRTNYSYLIKHPYRLIENPNGFIVANGKKYCPTHLIETKKKVNYDTLENRFLRWILMRIQSKLKNLKVRVLQQKSFLDPLLLKNIDRMLVDLNRFISSGFLSQVGEMKQISLTLVLQMAPGYRDVFRFYLIIMKGLSIQGDLLRMSLKDLAQLYEYWCFLKIHSLLKQKYELIHQDIIRVNRTGLFVTLDRSQKASVSYRNPLNNEKFTLLYNALPIGVSSSMPTLAQRPDNVLTLKKKDTDIEYKYIFDAKYRLNPAYEGTIYAQKYGAPGPEEEDINTMHRYRDAIVYENKLTGHFERSMFGAYVLFPYSDENKFREHQFYKSIKKVNIGAFPFLPQATKLMEEFLDELILDSPEKAYERSTRPLGTDKYYEEKLQGKNVLVSSLRDKEQFRLCLENNVYWIPLENIIKEQSLLTELEWIGLYQSHKTFGTKEGGINWIGKIAQWQVVRRYEIKIRKLRPGTENNLYVLFQIDSWGKLEKSIKPDGYGIYTHLFTRKYVFDRAETVAELKLDNEEQIKEWREKRRLGRIKIQLDDEYVDKANSILTINTQPKT